MNVRAIVAWTLYDFANSAFAAVIFATIYAAYYAIGVVGNRLDGRAGVDQLGPGLRRHMLRKAAYHPERVFQRVPA